MHPIIILTVALSLPSTTAYATYLIPILCMGYIFLAFFIAFFAYLFFEAPISNVLKRCVPQSRK